MVLARVLAVALLALLATVTIVAGVDSSSDGSPANSQVDAIDEGIGQRLVAVMQQNLKAGMRRLIVMQGLNYQFVNVPLICNGTPAIVAHTPQFPNKECWAATKPDLANNLSCTCLKYLDDQEEWTFKIKLNTRTTEEPLEPTQLVNEPIEVDSTMFYGVAEGVKSVVFEGMGATPLGLTIVTSPAPVDQNSAAKFIYRGSPAFKSLVVRNIDFKSNSPIKKDFVPDTLQNLTLSACNIGGIDPDLMSTFTALETLDLSNNAISEFSQDDLDVKTCRTNCLYTSMNLSNNALSGFPTDLLTLRYLKTLDLTGNNIKDLTLDTDTYYSLKNISKLEMDPMAFAANCSGGTVQKLSAAQVCVLNATTAATPAPPVTVTPEASSSSYLMYIVIGGCLVIAVLVFVLVKKVSCRSRDDDDVSKEPLDAYFDNTLSYEDTHATISASLLNDPIIITNRLPYKDLRVANCISKGGFGLVYSGVYNRRRVAIKKIRPDRAGDIKQIESFLKEICLIATLNHPRIVEFIGVSWDTLRNLCAVTEFMERGDLREVLHGFKLRNTPLTWESHKTTIALHIAEGVTYLHSLSPKIVHRDLKSKNVLLNGEMVAKLSDFGISRERHIEETHMTAGIGTSFWIAPEVLLGKDYDERADIFSFGVVLSEIDTDDYPYWNASNPNVGNKAQENMILQMVASGAMRPSFSETCPQAILELADLCLQVDPLDRPTAAEVAYKLQQIVQFMNPATTSTGSSRRVA